MKLVEEVCRHAQQEPLTSSTSSVAMSSKTVDDFDMDIIPQFDGGEYISHKHEDSKIFSAVVKIVTSSLPWLRYIEGHGNAQHSNLLHISESTAQIPLNMNQFGRSVLKLLPHSSSSTRAVITTLSGESVYSEFLAIYCNFRLFLYDQKLSDIDVIMSRLCQLYCGPTQWEHIDACLPEFFCATICILSELGMKN